MHWGKLVIAIILFLYFPIPPTFGWEDFHDREGTLSDWAQAVALSPDGTKVFAAGYTRTAAGGYAFTVRAYNTSNGESLWTSNYDREGNKDDRVHAVAVSPDGTKVFAAGETETAAGGFALTVRAYDASNGAVLWTENYDREGNFPDVAYAVAVSPDGTKVFASGYTGTSAGGKSFTVGAYDAYNGTILWTNNYDREGNFPDEANAVALSPDGTRVFAAGVTETTAGGYAFTVRAYNPSNGAVLWTQNYDREGIGLDWANAVTVSPDGTRIFAAGYTETTKRGMAFTVRAYNPSNGTPLWTKHYDRQGGLWDEVRAVAVSPDGSRVFAVGVTTTSAGGYAFTVRAYNSSNGKVLWAQNYNREGNGWDVADAVALSPDGTGIFAAGVTETTAGGYAFTVRAYNPSNGAVLWTQNYDREGTLSDRARAVAVSPDGSTVFAAGVTTTSAGGEAFTVRAYNATDGTP